MHTEQNQDRPKIFYGYMIVGAASFIMATVWGTNRSFGVFLKPMLSDFGWTRAGISGAFTLAMIADRLVPLPEDRELRQLVEMRTQVFARVFGF